MHNCMLSPGLVDCRARISLSFEVSKGMLLTIWRFHYVFYKKELSIELEELSGWLKVAEIRATNQI